MENGFLEVSDRLQYVSDSKMTVATLTERVDNHITFFRIIVGVFAAWLGAISLGLYNMNGEIGKLRLPQRLSQSADSPTNPKSQKEATTALASIKKESIPVPAIVIGDIGKRFVDAAPDDIGAWKVALEFIAYRSALNAILKPPDPQTIQLPPGTTWRYTFNQVSGRSNPTLAFAEAFVPAERGGRLGPIGVDENTSIPGSPVWLFAVGGAANLDGWHVRRVVFENVEIHYSGQPTIIEDAIFINCTFVMENSDRGRKLGQQLLASGSVSFQSIV